MHSNDTVDNENVLKSGIIILFFFSVREIYDNKSIRRSSAAQKRFIERSDW